MHRCFAALCLISLVIAVSISGGAQAPPSADAYVTTTQPGANFGSSSFLPVQAGTTSYIRLNLAVLPANTIISKATLRLYVNAVVAQGAFDVYQVNGAWSEQGLTMNSAPALGQSATGSHPVRVAATSRHQFLLVDITSLAQDWASGAIRNDGIALTLTSPSGSFSFDSKEGSGHQPELEIVLAAVQPVPYVLGEGSSLNAKAVLGLNQQIADPYVDNGSALQVGANFNIDGTGTAAVLNATSAYQLGGAPFISMSGWLSESLGYFAGSSNTGNLNTFAGVYAGAQNTTGAFNTVVGAQTNYANQTGSYNTMTGAWAGYNNTGTNNAFYGAYAGYLNTGGVNNLFFGTNAGHSNLTGGGNVFIGAGSGYNITTGQNNMFLGYLSGQNADPAARNNIYVGSLGAPTESGTIRIGDSASQTATYLAGISGAPTSSGVPVFIDTNGKLGTGGGSVSFTQVTGTVTNPQLTGTYTNQVVLSNTTNVLDGSFTGNFTGSGAGLTGVASGLAWPIVTKSADYAVQPSDFATPTTRGNYLVLAGPVSHKFTLPNPPPPNGYCVAIENVADAGINSGTNVFLTVDPNGLMVDNSVTMPTMPRRTAYLYCSDGSAGYYRLGYNQNGVSQIGPWLETLDTGVVNVYKTTYRNGMDFGLAKGSLIFLLVKNANTIGTPTLDVNGLGAKKILKYGNQPLAPGDLSTIAYAVLIYDGLEWQLLNPQTIKSTLTATTGTIGGTALAGGNCTTGTAAVTGATVGHPVSVSAADGSLPNGLVVLSAAVTSANVVTVQLCAIAAVTPTANTYNVATQ